MGRNSFKRSFNRLIARLRYGKKQSHNYQWLPYLILPDHATQFVGPINYKGQVVGELSSAGLLLDNSPDYLCIVGSGPSITSLSLLALPPRSTLLLNGAIHLIARDRVEPLAVIVEDERFVLSHFDEMRKLITTDIPCWFSPSVIRAICEQAPNWLTGRTISLVNNLLKPYNSDRRTLEELTGDNTRIAVDGANAFSLAPLDGIIPAGTVAYTAAQFAIARSPKILGFAGIEITNANKPRFYETSKTRVWSGLKKSEDYILQAFALAKAVADDKGILLENYSVNSALQTLGYPYRPLLEPAPKNGAVG